MNHWLVFIALSVIGIIWELYAGGNPTWKI